MRAVSLFGGGELAATGQVVASLTLDSNVVVSVGDDRAHEFRIENDIVLSTDEGELVVRYNPYAHEATPPTHITELTTIVGRRVSSASAYTDGVLVLDFEDGAVHALRVEPKERYEAWTYTHESFILSCPPGGRLDPS